MEKSAVTHYYLKGLDIIYLTNFDFSVYSRTNWIPQIPGYSGIELHCIQLYTFRKKRASEIKICKRNYDSCLQNKNV